mgnify:CR=1 FL=1
MNYSVIKAQMATDVFLKKYDQNAGILNKMKFEGEPYCNVIPNCDKILRLPFIKAIQPMGQGKYALVGYLRAKSPVTIIRHIWILDTSGNEAKIEKRIAFFGNAEYIAFCYNLLENELFVFQNMPRGTPIKENGIFIIKDDWTLSDAGISIKPLTKEDFNMFHQKSIMQNNQDIGIGIYKIPSGEPYGRMPSVNDTVSIYKILLK